MLQAFCKIKQTYSVACVSIEISMLETLSKNKQTFFIASASPILP